MSIYRAVIDDFIAGVNERMLEPAHRSIEFHDMVPDRTHGPFSDFPLEPPSVQLEHSFGYAKPAVGRYGTVAVVQQAVVKPSALWINPDKFDADRYNIADRIRQPLVDKWDDSRIPFSLADEQVLARRIQNFLFQLSFRKPYSPFDLEFEITITKTGKVSMGYGWAQSQDATKLVYLMVPTREGVPSIKRVGTKEDVSVNERKRAKIHDPTKGIAPYRPTLDFFLDLAAGKHVDEVSQWIFAAKSRWQAKKDTV